MVLDICSANRFKQAVMFCPVVMGVCGGLQSKSIPWILQKQSRIVLGVPTALTFKLSLTVMDLGISCT